MACVTQSEVLNADCLEVLAGLDAGSFDAMITDPPYGTDVPRDGYGRRQNYGGVAPRIANDSDLGVMGHAMTLAFPLLKRDSWATVFCSPKNRRGAEDACLAAGFAIKGEIVWDKKAPGLGGGIRYQHETILLCAKGEPSGNSSLFSVLSYFVDRNGRGQRHPHEKPVGLLRQLVSYASRPGDRILDPFAGIGGTPVACVIEGRSCLGCEIDPGYWAVAARRLADEVSRPSLFSPVAAQSDLGFKGDA